MGYFNSLVVVKGGQTWTHGVLVELWMLKVIRVALGGGLRRKNCLIWGAYPI